MTNPSSPSESSLSEGGRPDADLPEATPQPAVKAKRKGPRRATAPAGAPAASKQSSGALLLVDADGRLLPSPTAGQSQDSLPATVDAGATAEPAEPTNTPDKATPDATTEPAEPTNTPDKATSDATTIAAVKDKKAVVKARTQEEDGPAVSAPADLAAPPTDDSRNPVVAPPALDNSAGAREPRADKEDVPGENDPSKDIISAADAATVAGGAAILAAAAATNKETAAAANDLAPQSRRERRIAEQKTSVGVDHAKSLSEMAPALDIPPTVDPTDEMDDDPESVDDSNQQEPRKKRNRFTSFVRGLMAFLLISILVAALGTVLVGTDESLSGPADTEVNRQAAWERTVALSADALLLSENASTPEMSKALRSTAQDLDVQAASLDDGLPENAVEATETAVAAPTVPTPTAPTATLSSLLSGLTSSGETLMNDAVTAERAMGRVFAAVGTSQILQGQRLSALAGSTPPKSALLPVPRDFTKPQGPQCSSTLEPRSGVTVDSALLAAAQSEQKAIYAYQVAATRLDNPQFTRATELLARHEEKLELLNAELSVRCLKEISAVSGYELDPAFTAAPVSALAELELELSTIYANLAAVSTPAPESSPESAVMATPTGTTSNLAKPTSTTSADLSVIQPANNGLLREMSVAWLLDSSVARLYWGGTVAPMAGIAS